MKAVILVGGKGTRLLPLTEKVKKAYLPLGVDKRVIDHILDRIPKDVFDVKVVQDDSGAVSALANALPEKEPVLVVCGDNFFTDNLGAFYKAYEWEKQQALNPYLAMIGVYDVGDLALAKNYGVVSTWQDGTVNSFEEKPEKPHSTLVSAGIYLLPPASYSRIKALAKEKPEGNLGLVIKRIYMSVQVQTYLLKGYWIDIGTHETYKMAQEYLSNLT